MNIYKMRFELSLQFAACCGCAVGRDSSARARSSKLTLRQAVTLALQNSRELALARVQYTVALNAAGVDRAAFRPNLYTGSGAAYTYGFPSTVGGQAAVYFQLVLHQSIFNLPLQRTIESRRRSRCQTMKMELDRTRDDVIVRTATTYLELAKVRHSLDLLRKRRRERGKNRGRDSRTRRRPSQELPIEITRSQLTARARPRTDHQSRRPRRNSRPSSFRISPARPSSNPSKWNSEETCLSRSTSRKAI